MFAYTSAAPSCAIDYSLPTPVPGRKRRVSSTAASARQAVLTRHNVRIIGENKPPLLLCNGFGCSQHVWHYMTAALATHHQLVLFDYIGTGATDPADFDPQQYGSLNAYAQDVLAICRALDLRNAVLVGHSVGATIAMLAANAAPEYFSKVVLLTPSPYYLNEPGYYGGFERADMEQLLASLDVEDHSWANPFASLLVGPTNQGSAMEELSQYFCEMDLRVARHFARVAMLSDNRPDVSRLNIPALVLQCSQDLAVPAEVGEYLVKHLPQGGLVRLQATGHCPHLSAPSETLAAMAPFLA